jgi:hypothetical protein
MRRVDAELKNCVDAVIFRSLGNNMGVIRPR